jgi:hypothetical protein
MSLRVTAVLLMIVGASAVGTVTDTITTVTTTSETTSTETTTTETTTTETTTTETTTTETTITGTPPTACLRAFNAVELSFEQAGACRPIGGTCVVVECRQILEDLNVACAGEYLEFLDGNFSAGSFAVAATGIMQEIAEDEQIPTRRLSDVLQRFSEGLGRRLGYYYYEELEGACADLPLLAVFDNGGYEPTCRDALQILAFLGELFCGAEGQCSELCAVLVDNVYYRCHAEDKVGEVFFDDTKSSVSAEDLLLAPEVFSENCSHLVENLTLAPNASALLLIQTTESQTSTTESETEAETTESLGKAGEGERTTDEPLDDSTSSSTAPEDILESCAVRALAAPALAAWLLASLWGSP